MDWRFNTIWFDQLDQNAVCQIDFEEVIDFDDFNNVFYASIHKLKYSSKSFLTVQKFTKLLYLELNSGNLMNFEGLNNFKELKRLELHHCVKLENDFGIKSLSDNLEFLHINMSRKFKFSEELLSLKKLKVLCLNDCGDIENLDFLYNFPNLIDFRFVDTKVLSNDLSPILNHPSLRTVGFVDKRQYNFKCDQINSILENKNKNQYKFYVSKGEYETFRYDYD
jgi:hypothetical protein